MLLSSTDYIRRQHNLIHNNNEQQDNDDDDSIGYNMLKQHKNINKLNDIDKQTVENLSLYDGINMCRDKLEIDIDDTEQQILNWHIANIEYGTACNSNQLSLTGWDQDDIYFLIKGQHSLVKNGFISIIKHLANDINIIYNTVVQSIDYSSGNSVTINCVDRITKQPITYTGDQCVCTISLGCLKRNTIQFNPILPQHKQDAINHLGFGLLNKLVLEFDSIFWHDNIDMFGTLNNNAVLRGMYYMFWNLTPMNNKPILVALAAGQAAHVFETIDKQKLVDDAIYVLNNIFNNKTSKLVNSYTTSWSQDEFAYGSYSYIAVHSSGIDYDILSEPVNDILYFAGEATNRYQPATVPGAYISGLRAAGKIELYNKIYDVSIFDMLKDKADDYISKQATTQQQQQYDNKRRIAYIHKIKQSSNYKNLWGNKSNRRGFRSSNNAWLQQQKQQKLYELQQIELQQQQQNELIKLALQQRVTTLLSGENSNNNDINNDNNQSQLQQPTTSQLNTLRDVYSNFVRHSGAVESLFKVNNHNNIQDNNGNNNDISFVPFDDSIYDDNNNNSTSTRNYKQKHKHKHKHSHSDKHRHSDWHNKRYKYDKYKHMTDEQKQRYKQKKEEYKAKLLLQQQQQQQLNNDTTSEPNKDVLDTPKNNNNHINGPNTTLDTVQHNSDKSHSQLNHSSSNSNKHKHIESKDTVKQVVGTYIKSILKQSQYNILNDDIRKSIFKKSYIKVMYDWDSKIRYNITAERWMNDKRKESINELIDKFVDKINNTFNTDNNNA